MGIDERRNSINDTGLVASNSRLPCNRGPPGILVTFTTRGGLAEACIFGKWKKRKRLQTIQDRRL